MLPDRDTAEEVAATVAARFAVEGEPHLVRETLAGEDDADDAQWLVVVEGRELNAVALDALAAEHDGWLEED